jgi:hypothetical protein
MVATTTTKDGRPVIMLRIIEPAEITTVKQMQVGNEIKTVQETRVEQVVKATMTLALDEKEVQVYSSTGERIIARDVVHRVKRPTAVMVSVDGNPVDPFYLRLAREDVLVVVSPKLRARTPMLVEQIQFPPQNK